MASKAELRAKQGGVKGEVSKQKNGKERSKQASLAERQYRVNRLFNLIRNGGTQTDCIRFAEQQWGISAHTTKALMTEVRRQLRTDFELERGQFAAELMQQASSIMMEARRTNNLNAALGAVNTLARLGQIFS